MNSFTHAKQIYYRWVKDNRYSIASTLKSKYDQEMPQSHIADQPIAPWHRKTINVKQQSTT